MVKRTEKNSNIVEKNYDHPRQLSDYIILLPHFEREKASLVWACGAF